MTTDSTDKTITDYHLHNIFHTFNPLTHSIILHFETVPNLKKLQTTTEMWLLKDFKIQTAYRKHCGKRWNYSKFHLFPQCFPQVFFFIVLTHSQTATPLMPVGNKPFENTVGKGEIACNEQFLLFPQCFLPVWITFCHFRQIWNCRLQTLSVWKSLKFVVSKWVKISI